MQPIREEITLNHDQTLAVINQMAQNLYTNITMPEKCVVIGIRRGGALVARLLREQLNTLLGQELPIGFLDITFYRDDLDTVGPNPVVGPTDFIMDIDDKHIILVDDVLFTGRTIRAALNALFDYGRPEQVNLAVLINRGGRQLPIQADYTGITVDAGEREFVKIVKDTTNHLTVVKRCY